MFFAGTTDCLSTIFKRRIYALKRRLGAYGLAGMGLIATASTWPAMPGPARSVSLNATCPQNPYNGSLAVGVLVMAICAHFRNGNRTLAEIRKTASRPLARIAPLELQKFRGLDLRFESKIPLLSVPIDKHTVCGDRFCNYLIFHGLYQHIRICPHIAPMDHR